MRIGSLCSGIGLMELGLEWAGLGHTVFQVEIDPFCRSILAKHWPDVPRFDDVTQIGRADLPPADLVCFGSPCQDLSSAGKRAGLDGPKSRLFWQCARVVGELRPRWVVFENVASGASRWVDPVRSALAKLGYASLPIPIAASDLGAPHRRARVFIVAHLDGGGQSPVAVDAEVARASAVATDAHGAVLRVKPGRGGGANGGGAGIASDHGDETSADPRGQLGDTREGDEGQERPRWAISPGEAPANPLCARPEGDRPEAHPGRTRLAEDGWRPPVPDILRMVHGRTARLDRTRARIAALGNACVPAQAEAVGWVIRGLMGEKL